MSEIDELRSEVAKLRARLENVERHGRPMADPLYNQPYPHNIPQSLWTSEEAHRVRVEQAIAEGTAR